MTMQVPTLDTPVMQAAIEYVEMGLRPVPVYGVFAGRCMCNRGTSCPSPGKHPIGDDWQKRACRTVDEVREAFSGSPGNIGVCVADTPFVVLDADGAEGLDTLESLPLVPTLRAKSGSGGAHVFFRLTEWQDPTEISDRRAAPGLDVRKRGQVVAPPSRHYTGGRYEFVERVEIAPLPDAIYDLIRKPRGTIPFPPPAPSSPTQLASRARAYVAKMEPAISGQGGHNATFAVARKLVQDFGLTSSQAWDILCEYNERCQPPWNEKELRHKLDSAVRAHTRNPIQDRPRPPRYTSTTPPSDPPPPDDAWRAHLLYQETRTGRRKLITHIENVIRILSLSPEWRGRLRFDRFRGRVVVTDPPWDEYQRPTYGDAEWTDEDGTRLHAWLRRAYHEYAFAPSVSDCERAVDVVAHAHAFHPVADYLDGLSWDGTPRLDAMGARYLGAVDDEYASMVCRMWMISAVARIRDPGCKADHVLILEGRQGTGKSSALEILASAAWFSDTPIDLNSKDAYTQIRGRWIVELAELDSLFRAESSRAKAFFSSKKDDFRAAYARRERTQLRECVFAGTVNEGTYLKDPTGARRFWPLLCRRLDLAALRANRDQLWAEACALYAEGHAWHPETDADREILGVEQEMRTERDDWADWIQAYITKTGSVEVSSAELLEHALRMQPKDANRAAQTRVGAIMLHRLGWTKHRKRDGESLAWIYRRPGLGSDHER